MCSMLSYVKKDDIRHMAMAYAMPLTDSQSHYERAVQADVATASAHKHMKGTVLGRPVMLLHVRPRWIAPGRLIQVWLSWMLQRPETPSEARHWQQGNLREREERAREGQCVCV